MEAGKYQAVLGDCRGCHGKDLSGGVALMTPFGKLVTPNITPDKDTGIGNYSAEDFRQAMKAGIAPGSKLLYPAMPYPSYARMPDADIAALWDYLKTIKPVKKPVDVNQLHFPFNLRFMMRGWNVLFFSPAPYADTAGKSAAWNRGAYLVNGPGHCAACHTPKNFFGADKGTALTGASLQGWYAPDLTGDKQAGLGSWSANDIVEYLEHGAECSFHRLRPDGGSGGKFHRPDDRQRSQRHCRLFEGPAGFARQWRRRHRRGSAAALGPLAL